MKTINETVAQVLFMADEYKELIDAGYTHHKSTYYALMDLLDFIQGKEVEK